MAGLNKEEVAFTKILDACRSPPHDLLNASRGSNIGAPLSNSVGLKPALSVSSPRVHVPVPLAPHGAPMASVVSSLHSLESAYGDPFDSVVGELSTAFRVTHEDIVPRPDDWTGGEAAQSCLCGVWDHSTNRAMQQRHGPTTRVQEERQDAEACAEEREVEAFLEGLQRDMGGLRQIAHTLLSEVGRDMPRPSMAIAALREYSHDLVVLSMCNGQDFIGMQLTVRISSAFFL
jgi:hypothetical protein